MSSIRTSITANEKITSTRRVQFSHTTKARFIPGIWEMSEEEKEATWLTDEDNAQCQLAILKTVRRMRQGKEFNEEKYCTRGLEHMGTADLLKQREANKASVRNAVLSEQRRQRLAGHCNAEEIRTASILCSNDSRKEALKRGASAAVAEGFKVDRCPAKTCNNKVMTGDQGDSCNASSCDGKDEILSVLEKGTLPLSASIQLNQVDKSNEETYLPNRWFIGSCSSNTNHRGITANENSSSSSERSSSTNMFNRVLCKISYGLEGEVHHSNTSDRESSNTTPANKVKENHNSAYRCNRNVQSISMTFTQNTLASNCA